MRPLRLVPASLAGTVCLIAATAAPASAADAEVTPRRVAPGGTLTLSVSCGPTGGSIPGSIEASSQALAEGTVELRRVRGQKSDDRADGPAYRGMAKVAGPDFFSDKGPNPVGRISKWGVDGTCPGGEPWAASFEVDRGEDGPPPPPRPSHSPQPTHHGQPTHRPAHPTHPSGPVRTGVGGAFEGTDPVALLGGSALLLASAGGAVYWKRRSARGRS